MEVGKKYTFQKDTTIYTVIYKHPTGEVVVVFGIYGGAHCSNTIKPEDFRFYKEYTPPPEPVVHKRYVHWWKTTDGRWSVTVSAMCIPHKIGDQSGNHILVQKDEVTHTEYPT